MRHRKSGRKFNMDSSARKAMFRNMVTSLMLHGQIKTTVARAKELRKHAERVITIGKKSPSAASIDSLDGEAQRQARADRVAAIRRVRRWVNNDEALGRVFDEYAERFRARPGGYTRVIKTNQRAGDNAAMAIIALVGDYEPKAVKTKPEPKAPKAKAAAPAEAPVAQEADAEDDEPTVVQEIDADVAAEAEVVEEK